MSGDVKIGIIGGSGLYNLDGMTVLDEVKPITPWGEPSDSIIIGEFAGKKIAFLSRHGRGHYLNPSEVPVRANIAALKSLGVEQILAFSAVGSLREEIPPRDFVIPSQIIDRTKGIRPSTFFENGVVAHVPFADPFTQSLGELLYAKRDTLVDAKVHKDKTLVVMEGPAFSTRAESHLYRSWGGDIINMSALPESKLAREAEIAYQMVCMSTDYDCWKEDEEAVTVEAVIANLNANSENAKRLLAAVIPELTGESEYKDTFHTGIITAPESRTREAMIRLKYLFQDLKLD